MALYRFAAGVIARSAGHSSTAAAAYRAGERLTDERTGQTHDYSRRTGVLWTGIYAPKNAPGWVQDRSQLWNAAEKAEKRKDAQTAREFIVCLPHELDLEQGRRLVGDFLRENFARKGFVADAAIHAPGKGGDERNTHAHFLVTMRQVDGRGFAATKDRTQNEKATLKGWREAWARLGNRHLERAGHAGTLDHRSYEDQGIRRVAGQHIGKAAKYMERRGIPTEAAERRQAFEERVAEIADLRAELAKLEATPDAPAAARTAANDRGRPEGRPVNENAAERPPKAAPPILKAEAPAGPDPAMPIELATVPVRPAEPPPAPRIIEQTPAAANPSAAVVEATPRHEDPPARVEVSAQTSDPAEATPGPATVEARPPAQTRTPTRAKPTATARRKRTRLQRLFTAAAGWTRGLFARTRPAPDRLGTDPSKAPPAEADRRPPITVPEERTHEATRTPPGPQRPTPAAAIIPSQATATAAPPPAANPTPAKPYRMSKAELLAEQEARRIRKANKHGHGI